METSCASGGCAGGVDSDASCVDSGGDHGQETLMVPHHSPIELVLCNVDILEEVFGALDAVFVCDAARMKVAFLSTCKAFHLARGMAKIMTHPTMDAQYACGMEVNSVLAMVVRESEDTEPAHIQRLVTAIKPASHPDVLNVAAEYGQLRVLDALLDSRADLETVNKDFCTALMFSSQK